VNPIDLPLINGISMQAVGIAPIESIVTANNIILFSGLAKTTIMFLFLMLLLI